ncbi:MAG: transporter substrate-binding domain-containing protein [Clostridia bacterium]|nr:transporter substrate-binding domain-containing protein [Clostridia bacterium]
MKKLISIAIVCILVFSFAAMAETLKMGTNAAFQPYEYYDDESGAIIGIDAEVAALICEKLGYELEIVDMAFDSLIPALTSGKVDFVMAGMTVTEERKQSVDFSTSYAQGVQVVIVPEGSDITSIDDLTAEGASHKVGVQQGTTGDLYATWDIADAGLGSVEPYANGPDAVLALTSGKVDCVMIDNEPAKNLVAANEGLKILETPYTVEDYAIAVAKGSELTEKINAALEELIADGSVQAVIEKYIPAE